MQTVICLCGIQKMERYFAGPHIVNLKAGIPKKTFGRLIGSPFLVSYFPPSGVPTDDSQLRTDAQEMNVGLLGYGKMGKEVESVARQRGHLIPAVADVDFSRDRIRAEFDKCDVLIDFSVPAAVIEHTEFAAALGKPIIIGTTGWQKDAGSVRKIIDGSKTAAVTASNFSLGVNLFISAVENAARQFGRFQGFDCAVVELHHNQKSDAPSGTALTIGNTIMENFPSKKRLLTGLPDGRIQSDELHINSIRVGSEFGTHTVFFDSENDHIELTHVSRGRRGFALGAVMAAEWSVGKKGFYSFKDIISQLDRG